MAWILLYLILTLPCAATTFVAAEWFREPSAAPSGHSGTLAVLAGLLWPVLATGAAQVCLMLAVRQGYRAGTGNHRPW